MKESDLQKSIKEYLELKKYIVVKFQSVGIYDSKRDIYRKLGKKGVSDLLACQPKTGRFVAIEVKVKPNKPSQEQLDFLEEIKNRGGISVLAYSLEDVLQIL